MQAQVVHQHRATIPWAAVVLTCLLAIASVLAIQLAMHDRGATVTPPSVSVVDHGADLQKAGMSEAGIRNVSGTTGATAGEWVDPMTAVREGGATGIASVELSPGSGGPHPRVKFGGGESEAARDAALKATITRLRNG
jgi:hypothetical protein